ncbi:hypothetical protein GIB67_016741 [Kingdonia uniflora]|uniref:Proteasome maturation factor UMP1 n=1 Tax=Kingdonia uniflora TaxID=39325 RepID=A0A7J7LMS0_9MAGN|nr:hypothetical protein GIB67_016741 [Kingdonia uniflora]
MAMMEVSESKKKISHEVAGVQNDALRFGLNGVRSQIIGDHPVQTIYESSRRSATETKHDILALNLGSSLLLKMDLDRQILSRFQRPPGALPSSMLGLEALTGSLDDYNFGDYHCLNDPGESETYRPSDMHHGMEVRIGMSKGPVCPSFI